jgi:hypothetical protein
MTFSAKLLEWKNKLECFFVGHDILVTYPWHEQKYKNGTFIYTISEVRYCGRCKRAFK